MSQNKLIIAAAGSGKTTHLVSEARKINENRALITTYTEANELEIRRKFKVIPSNIDIQTWFSFLLEHGVRPYQSFILDKKIRGMLLVNSPSGIKFVNRRGIPIPYDENRESERHYLTFDDRIYSDKLSKFVCKCNEKSNGAVLKRLAQIYTHIFIDEVQDLAGYDLELIQLMMKAGINVCLVGDPRQVTYLTNHPRKYPKYKEGKIKEFIENELPKNVVCEIDETTLSASHRNNQEICNLSSKLYPSLSVSTPCSCTDCLSTRNVQNGGIYLVHSDHIDSYIAEKSVVQLRWNKTVNTSLATVSYNMGNSKGLGFDHVLVYLTKDMWGWIFNHNTELTPEVRAKLYVAITRARHSVAFVISGDCPASHGYKIYTPPTYQKEAA